MVTVIILSVFFFKRQFQSRVAVPLLNAQNEKSAQIVQIRVLHNNHLCSIVWSLVLLIMCMSVT